MADPYSGVPISNYNANPPADDGSQTEANRVKWSTIKTKITDPVKTRTDDMNTALIAAFAKMIGGAGITSTAINYTVLSADQGKLVRASVAGITITTPDATDVDAPFVFAYLNDSDGDTTLDGSGSQTIDGDANVTVPPGAGVVIFTDGVNWYTTGQNFQRTLVAPMGRLTPVSGTPVISSDSIGATAVYYTPFNGNLIPVPNGSLMNVREFSELTLTLHANHSANTIYDVFIFENSGTLTIGTGPAWSNSGSTTGARGTGAGTTELERLKGLWVNKVAVTMRNGSTTYSVSAKCGIYVGSILIDGSSGQVTCHVSVGQSRRWGVWNAYNRKLITLLMCDGTSSWNYSTNQIRQSNGAAGNTVKVFAGLAEEMFDINFTQNISAVASSSSPTGYIGIGWSSTVLISGKFGVVACSAAATAVTVNNDASASYQAPPALGMVNVNALETGTGVATITYAGIADYMRFSAKWLG